MAEVKSSQITISLEPTLRRKLEKEKNVSGYIRMLIIADMMKKQELTTQDLLELFV